MKYEDHHHHQNIITLIMITIIMLIVILNPFYQHNNILNEVLIRLLANFEQMSIQPLLILNEMKLQRTIIMIREAAVWNIKDFIQVHMPCHVFAMISFVFVFVFGQVMSPYHPDQMPQRSQISEIAQYKKKNNFTQVHKPCHVFAMVFVFVFGHALSPHHSDQMGQRSQVSRIAPLRCFLMELNR